ncbi:MAG: beta-ketoacyl-ACP synthase III [bacterium]
MSKIQGAMIAGTGSYVPEAVLTNLDLEKKVNTSDAWIVSRTGISERRICSPEMTVVDLAAEAGKRALADAGISAAEVELIIVATVTAEHLFPSVACLVQERLGAAKAAAFDLSAACAGFIYSLETAAQFIKSGTYTSVLVIGAEVLSRFVDWKDRNTCILFGDGAGAVVLCSSAHSGLLGSHLQADGSGGNLLKLCNNGNIEMCGNEVFRFAVKIMGDAVEQVLEKLQLKKEDLDYLIPHQANIRIIQSAAKRLDLPMDKVYVNVNKYGNTSAASIPLALDEAVKAGKIKAGDLVALVGFGAGLTWAASVIRWGKKEEKKIDA